MADHLLMAFNKEIIDAACHCCHNDAAKTFWDRGPRRNGNIAVDSSDNASCSSDKRFITNLRSKSVSSVSSKRRYLRILNVRQRILASFSSTDIIDAVSCIEFAISEIGRPRERDAPQSLEPDDRCRLFEQRQPQRRSVCVPKTLSELMT